MISRKTKQIVHDRSGGVCEVLGCMSRDLESPPHHVKYRSRGGSDEPINLIDVCKKHHREIHDGQEEWTKGYRSHRWNEEGTNELGEQIWK